MFDYTIPISVFLCMRVNEVVREKERYPLTFNLKNADSGEKKAERTIDSKRASLKTCFILW